MKAFSVGIGRRPAANEKRAKTGSGNWIHSFISCVRLLHFLRLLVVFVGIRFGLGRSFIGHGGSPVRNVHRFNLGIFFFFFFLKDVTNVAKFPLALQAVGFFFKWKFLELYFYLFTVHVPIFFSADGSHWFPRRAQQAHRPRPKPSNDGEQIAHFSNKFIS